MTPELRTALEEELTLSLLAQGKGDVRQRRAYEELEWRRCAADPIYFFEHYGFIVVAGRIVKWDLWPIQRQVIETLHRGEGVCGVKARQLGITTTIGNYAHWDALFHDAVTWDNISANEEKGKDIIRRIGPTKDRLPYWMIERALARGVPRWAIERAEQDTSSPSRKKVANAVRNKRSDALLRISYGQSEVKVACSTLRNIQGATANINLDEATLHDGLKEKLQQMQATLDGSKGVGAVIANGKGRDDFFWFYQNSKPTEDFPAGQTGFKAFFFWWGDDPNRLEGWDITRKDGSVVAAKDMLRSELLKYAPEQRDNCPWYYKMKHKFLFKNPEADEFAFRAIYPTTEDEAFFLSGNSRFSHTVLNRLTQSIERRPVHGYLEPTDEGVRFRGNARSFLAMWELPYGKESTDATLPHGQQADRYVIGVDPSGGTTDGDYAVAMVCKILPGGRKIEQVAVYAARVEPSALGYEVLKLARFYNEAFVVVEANNHGPMTISVLKEEYSNLYMRKVYDQFTDKAQDPIGFWTGGVSKNRVIDQLGQWLSEDRIVMADDSTMDELATFEMSESGKTGAPKGHYDDRVMALAFCVEGAADLLSYKADMRPVSFLPWEG